LADGGKIVDKVAYLREQSLETEMRSFAAHEQLTTLSSAISLASLCHMFLQRHSDAVVAIDGNRSNVMKLLFNTMTRVVSRTFFIFYVIF
jgi:hypothetical protein